MAGEAKTSSFMLGTATVMLGPQEDLFDLTPELHSIGLVKNFRVMSEPAYTDLTQGVTNRVVYSVMTGNTVRASMEAYEYTAKNISYALGLEGVGVAPQTVATTVETLAAAEAVVVLVDDELGFAIGDHIMIQDGADDRVYVRQVTAVTAGSLSFTQPLPAAVPVGATVRKATAIDVGARDVGTYLSAKIVGTLADKSEVVLLCPKIRITNGFSVGFTTEGFDNMPLEFSFYDQLVADPFFTQFNGKQAQLFTAS